MISLDSHFLPMLSSLSMIKFFIVFAKIKPLLLNQFQLKKLSEFFFTAGQLVLGSIILKFLESEILFPLDKSKQAMLSLWIIAFVVLIFCGLFFAGKVEEEK